MTSGVEPDDDAVLLRQHLDTLFPLIQEGASRGLHQGLRHLRRAGVESLLDITGLHHSEEESRAAFRAAGDAVVYGALVLAYTQRVALLDALGEDTIPDKARLRRCLTHPSPASAEVAPAPWLHDRQQARRS